MTKERETSAHFAVTAQTAKPRPTLRERCSVKTETVLSLYSKYFERERSHNFIIICAYNCSILLFVIVLILLCLIYTLNFTIGRYAHMYRKNIVYMGFGNVRGSRHPRGGRS